MAVSDVLKACTDPVEPGGIYLVYAKAPITGTSCPKGGSTSPELGITFSSPGPAAPGGSYFAVQIINSDAVINQPTVGLGLDVLPKSTSYKYGGTGDFPASDSPKVCLSCTNLLNLTRAFSAVMFVMWQSTTTNSIPVPVGYEVWSFKGQAINSNGWKMNGPASTSPGTFVPSAGNQTATNPVTQVPLVNGFPTWTGSVQ